MLYLAILEAKFAYYYPGNVDDSWLPHVSLSDPRFDALESQLKEVWPEYDVVGYPLSPEGWFVSALLSEPKKQASYIELLGGATGTTTSGH